MKPETLKALRESIAKWEKNSRIRNIENAKIGPDSCALCSLFYTYHRCRGCPVREETGFFQCEHTPNSDAEDAINDNCGVAEFRRHAKREVAFLKSLLPDGDQ